jgi:hypothetical protein
VEAQFCESSLQEQLERCAEWLERAERHELQVPLYRLITPLYEARRDYVALATGFNHLAQSCSRAAECARGGRRLLGTYYRVAFYGQVFTIVVIFILILIYHSFMSRIIFDLKT